MKDRKKEGKERERETEREKVLITQSYKALKYPNGRQIFINFKTLIKLLFCYKNKNIVI